MDDCGGPWVYRVGLSEHGPGNPQLAASVLHGWQLEDCTLHFQFGKAWVMMKNERWERHEGRWGDHVGEGEARPAGRLVTWNRLPCSCQASASPLAVAAVDGTWPVLPVGVCGAAGVPSQVCAGGERSLDHPGPVDPLGGGRVF